MGRTLTPPPVDPRAKLAEELASIKARLARLEAQAASVPVIVGAPSGATGQEGSLAGDTAPKLWLKVGGVWRSVTLT